MSDETGRSRRVWHALIPLLVVGAGGWAYHNSFSGPFIYDDLRSILHNPHIRHLWPLWDALTWPMQTAVSSRPVVGLSLAVNYALGGLDVRGYHAVNLLIHILAALTLYGVLRRTFLSARLRQRYGHAARGLAFAAALIWMVHPLQTQSVTYIVQRTESFMGLWYLLTLYGFIRGCASARPRRWLLASVGACAMGMASKEVMVSAPLMVLWYDRVFISASTREWIRKRGWFYLGLAATWLLLGALVATQSRSVSAGFGVEGLSPSAYAVTQFGVIVRYLQLAIWPDPLVLYYNWPIARSPGVLPLLVVGNLLVGTIWSCRRYPALGFLGAWFFLILAPTSSIMPILGEQIAERRMYLPLASVVVLFVIGGYHALGLLRPGRASDRMRSGAAVALTALVVVLLGSQTIRRNADFRSARSIWEDTLAKRPHSPRAMLNLGIALARDGSLEEAVVRFQDVLRLAPDHAEARNNLGAALGRLGRVEESVDHFDEAIRISPEYSDAHYNLGLARVKQGRLEEAVHHYARALQLDPTTAKIYYDLGVAYGEMGRLEEAATHLTRAVEIDPRHARAYFGLGVARDRQGRAEDAMTLYAEAIRLDAGLDGVREHLERLRVSQGDIGDPQTDDTL